MTGAALLAARAALKTGAGKVLVGFAESASPLPCDPLQPELMLRDARSLLDGNWNVTTWVAGCGIGDSPLAADLLARLFARRGQAPLVLDADGLNLLARGQVEPHWGDGPVVLTPHPAEAARLLGRTTAQVQADRPTAAQQLAGRYDAWIVLKGPAPSSAPPMAAGDATPAAIPAWRPPEPGTYWRACWDR